MFFFFYDISSIEFDWKMDYLVKCELQSNGNEFQTYIGQLGSISTCNVDVSYKFVATNSGTKCEYINSIDVTIYGNDVVGPVPINLDYWSELDRYFCPGETLNISLDMEENLCELAGNELGFELMINNETDPSKIGFISFPIESSLTYPPTVAPKPLDILVDNEIKCKIFQESGEKVDCEKFLMDKTCDSSMFKKVTYIAKITNVGKKCGLVDKAIIKVGAYRNIVRTKEWDEDRKNFCPDEFLFLSSKPHRVNICNLEGQEFDTKVIIKSEGFSSTGFGVLSFPKSNGLVTPSPTKAAVATPAPTKAALTVPAPTTSPSSTTCGTKPIRFSFKVKLNRSGGCVTGRRQRRHLGGGKGSNNNYETQQCNSCVNTGTGVSITSSSVLFVAMFSSEDSKTILYSGTHLVNQKFNFRTQHMPDCLVIQISTIVGTEIKVIQTVSFESSCSNKLSSFKVNGGMLKLVDYK